MTGPITIDDTDDDRVADYVRLKDVNLRRTLEAENGRYLAEGQLVIARALEAGHQPASFLVAPDRLEQIVPIAGDRAPIYVMDAAALESLTGFDVHRGAIASMNRPRLPELATVLDGAKRVVVLEDLTSHTNVGAIFRSVAALGADAVLVTPRCADPLYRRAIRVSMGTVFQIPWTRVAPWPGCVAELRATGLTVVAFTPSEDAVSLDELAVDPPPRLAMVFGTEMEGIRAGTAARADIRARIPMTGGISSLNVAAAAAVAMWALRPG